MKAFINKSYIKSHIEDDEVIIDDLYVDPAARGGKMGYRLLDLVKDIARSMGHNMALYVNPDHDMPLNNEQLVEYYMEYGFASDPDCSELMTYTLF